MKFTLQIELGNDAMQSWKDVRQLLNDLRHYLSAKGSRKCYPDEGAIVRDENGNVVGKWEVNS